MPVVLITPTTMPTAEAAAPTARAYCTPTCMLAVSSRKDCRGRLFSTPITMQAIRRAQSSGEKTPLRVFQSTKASAAAGTTRVSGF